MWCKVEEEFNQYKRVSLVERIREILGDIGIEQGFDGVIEERGAPPDSY